MPIEQQDTNVGINKDVESKEQPAKTIVFVYRGSNPLIQRLASQMEALGMKVITKTIPEDTDYNICDNPKELESLLGALKDEGEIFVTDTSLNWGVKKMVGDSLLVNAYEFFGNSNPEKIEDVVNMIAPTIEQIQKSGREPVLLADQLGDHISFERLNREERRNMQDNKQYKRLIDSRSEEYDALFAGMINMNFDIPVISKSFFRRDQKIDERSRSAIHDFLEENKIDPKKSVYLTDHHIYSCTKEKLENAGLANQEIALICPCCVNSKLPEDYKERLERLGLRIFPLNSSEIFDDTAKKLKDLIEARTK